VSLDEKGVHCKILLNREECICVQDPKSVVDDDILPDGTAVKKGSMIMYAPYAMGRMPSLWGPDATEFRPARWIANGVVQPESPFKFAAFQVSQPMLASSIF
jgi:cytochrome P450